MKKINNYMTREVTIPSQNYAKGTFSIVSVDLRYSGYVPIAVIGIKGYMTNGSATAVLSIGDVKISNDENSSVTIWNNYSEGRTVVVTLTVLYVQSN